MSMLFKRIKDWAVSITSFRTGDVIAVDGPNGTAKMTKDSLLQETAQSTLAGNLAPAFDPTRTEENKYLAGDSVLHDGVLKTFAVDHYGPWNDADVLYSGESAFEALVRLKSLGVISSAHSYDDFVQGMVNPNGNVSDSNTNRRRGRFIYAYGGYLIAVCPGYYMRLTFFRSNTVGPDYAVKTSMAENQNWQDGDAGVKLKVPDGAINFVFSLRRKDNADFTSNDKPIITYGLIQPAKLLRKGMSNQLIVDSQKTVMSYPEKKVNSSLSTACLVKVTVPQGYKARIVYSTYETSFAQNAYYLPWLTESFTTRIYDLATFYAVQFMKVDESDITDSSYLECNAETTTNSLDFAIVSLLGDSITTFGGSTSDPNNARYAVEGDPTYPGNRCRYPQTDLGIADGEVDYTYWMRVIKALNMRLGVNESWAGSRISNSQATDSGDFGPNRCLSSQTRINHLGANGTPDLILVYGGTNDAGGNVALGTFNTESPINYTNEQIAALPVATFADACRTMMIRLQKTYPNAKIVIILPNYVTSYYNSEKLDPYCDMLKTVCDYFGVQYIDFRTSNISMFNASSYLNDGIHPNKNGMLALADCIIRSNSLSRDII